MSIGIGNELARKVSNLNRHEFLRCGEFVWLGMYSTDNNVK